MAGHHGQKIDFFGCLSSPYTMNCSAVAPVASAIIQGNPPNYRELFQVVTQHDCMASTASVGMVVNDYVYWARHRGDNATISDLAESINRQCRKEFCRALPFTGNPDFAGVGVGGSLLFHTSQYGIIMLTLRLGPRLVWHPTHYCNLVLSYLRLQPLETGYGSGQQKASTEGLQHFRHLLHIF